MSSLKADFDELRERIRHGRELGHASFEPIYYLVFPPEQILEVKRQTPAWVAKLHQEGWDVHSFSIAEHVWTLLKEDPFWSLCVMEDKAAPLDWSRTNKALADILTADNALLKRLEAALQPLEGRQTIDSATSVPACTLSISGMSKCGCSLWAKPTSPAPPRITLCTPGMEAASLHTL